MKIIKKILHWLGFIIGAPILVWVILSISVFAPLYAYDYLQDLGSNIHRFVMPIVIIIYYLFFTTSSGVLFLVVNKMKPDYWVSNIILSLVSILFFGTFFNYESKGSLGIFGSSEGLTYVTMYVPALLLLVYKSIIYPFKHHENEKWAYLLL